MNAKMWWAQTVHNKLIALTLAMIVLVSLVATPAATGMRGLAALAYEGMGLVMLAALLWRADWQVTKEKLYAFLRTGAHLPVLLFLGLTTISCLLSPHKAYSEQEWLRVGTGIILYFTIAHAFRRTEQLARMVDALVLITIGASILGLAQYGSTHSLHATGIFGDHQLFGSFLMILLPIVGIVAVSEPNPNRQLAAQSAAVMAATCLLLSQARSAWVGAAVGLGVLSALALALAWRDQSIRRNKHRVAAPLLLLVLAVGFFLLIWPQTGTLVDRATSLQHADTVGTWQVRQHTWRGAWKMIADRPLTGFGLGLYAYYQKPYTSDGIPISVIGGAPSLGEQAHNTYLQTAAELGLPGLLLLISVLVTFLIAGLWRVGAMEAGLRRSLLLGSMASTAAFAVDAYASPSWQCGQISMFLWLTLGLGAACLQAPLHSRGKRLHSLSTAPAVLTGTRFLWTRPAGVLAAIALALLLPTVVLAVGDLYATPTKIEILPADASIRGGGTQTYTVYVTFSDGQRLNVTKDAGSGPGSSSTTISETGGQGFMTGTNNSVYQSKTRENSSVTISASYTQTLDPQYTNPAQISGSISGSTGLTVHYP